MRVSLGEDEVPEIGLIALIDCIFFLLMFFMVATSFKMQESQQREKFQPIVLPTSQISLDPASAADAPFVIGIDKDGGLFHGNDPVSLQTLREKLRQVARSQPGRLIRIDGDRRTPFQNMVHVLDLCQFEGLVNIAVRTRN
jgi:biopolymer transport protein ExbD